MRGNRVAAIVLIPFTLLVTSPGFAGTVQISHDTLQCAPEDGNAKVAAQVPADAKLAEARVYFRAAQYEEYRYLEMRKGEDGNLWAILPIPKNETKEIKYRVAVKDRDGLESSTELLTVPVKSCDAKLTDVEKGYAQNLVIGLTDDKQNPVPEGFKCEGVISKITVQGVLMPHDECAAVIAAFLIPPGVWVAAGAAAVAGGVVIATDKDPKPISPYRPSTNR